MFYYISLRNGRNAVCKSGTEFCPVKSCCYNAHTGNHNNVAICKISKCLFRLQTTSQGQYHQRCDSNGCQTVFSAAITVDGDCKNNQTIR